MIRLNKTIKNLYKKYLNKIPLDLVDAEQDEIDGWKNNVQLSIYDFSRIVALVYNNDDMRNFTCSNIDLDLDNIEPIITLLLEESCIKIVEKSKYSVLNLPKPNKLSDGELNFFTDAPNDSLNQFPCSVESRIKRVQKLIEDFPYVEEMNVGLMGDDDLVSLEIAKRTTFTPVVFELDKRTIEKIKKISIKENFKIKIVEKDFRDLEIENDQIDTFFADPPYTVGGVLTFLYYGLRLTKNSDKVYLIANQMFLGKRGMPEIFKILNNSGIYITEIINGFNEYPLPNNYRETIDLSNQLKKFGDIDVSKIMSSSSSLFVLKIDKLNLSEIKKFVEKCDNIYDRYKRYSK